MSVRFALCSATHLSSCSSVISVSGSSVGALGDVLGKFVGVIYIPVVLPTNIGKVVNPVVDSVGYEVVVTHGDNLQNEVVSFAETKVDFGFCFFAVGVWVCEHKRLCGFLDGDLLDVGHLVDKHLVEDFIDLYGEVGDVCVVVVGYG